MAILVRLGRLVLLDLPALPDLLARLDLLEQLALPDLLAQLVLPDLPVLLAQLVPLAQHGLALKTSPTKLVCGQATIVPVRIVCIEMKAMIRTTSKRLGVLIVLVIGRCVAITMIRITPLVM